MSSLYTDSDEVDVTSLGRPFHTFAPATGKARPPIVDRRLVPVRYCTTWHYPDRLGMTFKYGRIRVICHDFCDSELFLMQWTLSGHCLATVFDARHCGITRDRKLPTWLGASRGESRWQSTVGRFNQSVNWHGIVMYVLTDKAITQYTLLLLQHLVTYVTKSDGM